METHASKSESQHYNSLNQGLSASLELIFSCFFFRYFTEDKVVSIRSDSVFLVKEPSATDRSSVYSVLAPNLRLRFKFLVPSVIEFDKPWCNGHSQGRNHRITAADQLIIWSVGRRKCSDTSHPVYWLLTNPDRKTLSWVLLLWPQCSVGGKNGVHTAWEQ